MLIILSTINPHLLNFGKKVKASLKVQITTVGHEVSKEFHNIVLKLAYQIQ